MSSKLCRCGRIVSDRCDRCQKRTEKRSVSAEGHGYDHRIASERYRKCFPLCERCVMLYGTIGASPARSMHHIESIKDAPEKRMEPSNWLAVCEPCHEAIEGKPIDGMIVKRWSEENYWLAMEVTDDRN